MPTLDKTITQLNHLLITSHDASLNYRRLADSAETAEQRHLFSEREQQCSALQACLHQQIVTYGGRPQEHPSLWGALRHGWRGLSAALMPERGRTRMHSALRTEQCIRHGFEQLLAEELAPEFRQQLQAHNSLSVEFERLFRARL